MRARAMAAAFAAVLVFAACGGDDENDPAEEAPTTEAVADPTTTAMDHSDGEMDHDEHGEDGHEGGDDQADASAADVESGFADLVNGHHEAIELEPLDAATQAELDAQLAITREVAAMYPTVADAEAAGYRRAGPFSPGLGTHYAITSGPNLGAGLNPDGVMDEEDLRHPLSIIYTGSDPDSEIAGFMYYSMSTEPEGFAGDNDYWHYHTNTCIKRAADGGIDAPFGADAEVTVELCEQAGGTLLEQTQTMVHVWTIDGYEVADEDGGVFGEVNRNLACDDGTYHILEMEEWIDYPLNVCQNNPA
jgi:hypothetical protein